MNKVLAAERMSEAQLIEARTKAQTQQIDAQAKAEMRKIEAEAQAVAQRLQAQADAESSRIKGATEMEAFQQSNQAAAAFAANPALLRLRELDALKDLAKSANARIYIGFDKHAAPRPADD
jgi:regulator of protease activity HflC (stomatin/prohibitin superfamily)